MSPDGPAKGNDLNFIYKANTTNIHTQTPIFKLHGDNAGATLGGDFNIDSLSSSGNTVLDVQGTEGQLFSVTNSLTGDLFSVADVSGIPILNVNSNGDVDVDGELNIKNAATRFISLNYEDSVNSIISHSGTNYGLETLHVRGDQIKFYTDYDASSPKGNLTLTLDTSHNATFQGTLTLSGKSSATQYIKQESHGDLYVQTTHGYFKAGPGNSSYCHVTTDRGRFYMNKRLVVDDGIFASYDEDLKLYRADNASHSMTLSTTAATFTHDVVAYSDEKLKENIKTLDGSKVYDMRGVSFNRIDTGLLSSGVIAQEMQKIAPELVSENNGTLGVSYGNITGYLIEAIKELKQEIEQLKKQINNG
jgi:hypothetical protein